MSTSQIQALNRIIKNGWKSLAVEDQSDADAMRDAAKEILEALEKVAEADKPQEPTA